MSVPALTAKEIFWGRPVPKPPDARGQSEVLTNDGEGGEWSGPQPQKQKSVDIGLWAKFPNKFFGSGMARKVGASASVLYFALCENANREPSNTFKASDKALASETDLSPRTIRDARIKLIENGLISCSREPGQSFIYTLLHQKLQWLKRSERPRQKLKPRALAAARVKPKP